MSDTVQQIKDRLSIVDVVSQYVKLERSGSSLRARCPFHAERTPSFFVSPERGTYHCFGCNVGGDIFSFVEQIEGLDFKGALKILAEKAGVPLEYVRGGREEKDAKERILELLEIATIFFSSHLSGPARDYLTQRGIGETTIAAFRLGWAGDGWSDLALHLRERGFSEKEMLEAGVAKNRSTTLRAGGDQGVSDKFRNRIIFPIADPASRVVGFSGRIFGDKASPEAPKYLNSPETAVFHKSRILYGFDKAKLSMRKHNCAILVEGQLDLLASYQSGWANTVAVSGTAFTPEHARLIKRTTDNLVIALDPDPAGIKAAGRAARIALLEGLNVKVAQLPTGLDPSDLIAKEGKDTWSKAIRHAKDIIIFLLDVLEKHAKTSDNFRRSVESIVLPFLADVQSPIAREKLMREVAKRLGVSEQAVLEALGALPLSEGHTTVREVSEKVMNDRSRHAFSILLWQKSLSEPVVDVERYTRDLEESLGPEMETLRALSESEKEALRFTAERIYGGSAILVSEVRALLDVLLRERLTRELRQETEALRRAESQGDERGVAVHMSVCNVLTTKIANLERVV